VNSTETPSRENPRETSVTGCREPELGSNDVHKIYMRNIVNNNIVIYSGDVVAIYLSARRGCEEIGLGKRLQTDYTRDDCV